MVGVPALRPETFSRSFPKDHRAQIRKTETIKYNWAGVTAEEFIAELSAYVRWYREGRLKAFREGGGRVYNTIRGRRERLGLAV